MRLTRVHTKNFRCFTKATFDLDARVVLIRGKNGAGKSSVLEALHYLCYLRSFRTHLPLDLIRFEQEGFFLKAQFCSGPDYTVGHELQVGFIDKKRSVKLNQKPIHSFKELMDHYRIVTLSEDDLVFIKGGPDVRRRFVDQAILLGNQGYAADVRAFKQVLENRKSLLQSGSINRELHELWTKQLWERSRAVQRARVKQIEQFAESVNGMLAQIFDETISISLDYRPKKDDLDLDFEKFMVKYRETDLLSDERRYGRSLFGAHLDDIIVGFQDKRSKRYASRGQQKLTVLLLKVSQLNSQRGRSVMLLDDFMTDFDQSRARDLVHFLASLPNQLIFTCPIRGGLFDDLADELAAKKIDLSN